MVDEREETEELEVTKKEAIRQELETVRGLSEDGLLKPENVVLWAKNNRRSVLHGQFEWNDKNAAQAYRVEQARNLIRVVVVPGNTTPQKMRAFVSIPSDRQSGGGYRGLDDALMRARQELVNDAVKQVLSMTIRFTHLPELSPLWAGIHRVVEEFLAANRQAAAG